MILSLCRLRPQPSARRSPPLHGKRILPPFFKLRFESSSSSSRLRISRSSAILRSLLHFLATTVVDEPCGITRTEFASVSFATQPSLLASAGGWWASLSLAILSVVFAGEAARRRGPHSTGASVSGGSNQIFVSSSSALHLVQNGDR
uniref:Uncharacterized protein n=1 Tax=Oryza meridionalis TaxID=40149 RepID=A0A0E0E494_9ORYZ